MSRFRNAFPPVTGLALVALAAFAPLARAADVNAGPDAARAAARAKIAPWLLEHANTQRAAEFIVVMNDQADLSGAAAIRDKVGKTRFVRDALLARASTSQAPLLAWLDAHGVGYRSFYIVNAVLVNGTLTDADAIAARADVARLDGNPEMPQLQPVALTPDELAASARQAYEVQAVEPGITAIRAPLVWATGATGQGIVVGTADTGVLWTHAALKGHYRGWDGVTAHHDYNWHDAIHTGGGVCGPNAPAPCDDFGHGTHTIGTVLGGDSSGTNQIGVAPGAKFIACRNMDQGNGTPARYLECMEWFLAPYPVGATPAEGDPAMAPDVTNNSWGCPASEGCMPLTLQAGVEAQRAAGIMFVASAGNSGSACSTVSEPPGTYDAAYSVGAYAASTGTLASFSSRGPVTVDGSGRMKPDISAPGVSVRSAYNNGAYASLSGTSMAGPHVAGAVALLWSGEPELRHRIDQTERILDQSAVPVASASCDAGGVPNNVYGWGRLDVKAALDLGPLAVAPAGGLDGRLLSLAPAYPNPARRSSALRYRLASVRAVDLSVYSASGQLVRTLERGVFAAGERSVRWDGRDEQGHAAPPAVYLVRLASGRASSSQKLIWLGP